MQQSKAIFSSILLYDFFVKFHKNFHDKHQQTFPDISPHRKRAATIRNAFIANRVCRWCRMHVSLRRETLAIQICTTKKGHVAYNILCLFYIYFFIHSFHFMTLFRATCTARLSRDNAVCLFLLYVSQNVIWSVCMKFFLCARMCRSIDE